MPSFLAGRDPANGLKAICIFPGNPALGQDAHQGGVLVSSARTGELLALVNGSALTEVRTAAVSAVATSLLARPDADRLAIVGTGVQARAHALAISATLPLAEIRLAGRRPGAAARLADDLRDRLAVPVLACDDAAEAVAGASIVVTATSSATPVLRRGWLAEGTHINAVGACLPAAREIDTATIADAALFVDSRESAAAESGDFLLAQAEGAIDAGHIRAELGEVLTGSAPGAATPARSLCSSPSAWRSRTWPLPLTSTAKRPGSAPVAGWISDRPPPPQPAIRAPRPSTRVVHRR